MKQPDFAQARAYALTRLERELSPRLIYHSLAHTHDDVVPAAECLAYLEGISGESLLLLQTAAYYHDIGFVEQQHDHEAAGVCIARAVLPDCGYTQAHIDIIDGLIMATKLPQSPRTLLEQVMADADLDNLGRDDFLHWSLCLQQELAAHGTLLDNVAWYCRQMAFLSQHRYFTRSAHQIRDQGKQRNIATLYRLLTAI